MDTVEVGGRRLVEVSSTALWWVRVGAVGEGERQDITVPFAEPVPEFDTTVQRADTQELSAHMEKIRNRERVA